MAFLGMAASTVLAQVAPGTFPPPGPGPAPLPSAGWYAVTLAYSFAFAVLGGHTCARLARREEAMHAAVLAALIGALGIRMLLDTTTPLPLARTAGYVAVNVLGVLMGGALRARAKQAGPDATRAR
jgi:hypothetical protein